LPINASFLFSRSPNPNPRNIDPDISQSDFVLAAYTWWLWLARDPSKLCIALSYEHSPACLWNLI